MGKEELLGVKTFDFKLDEERDRVYLVKYIPNNKLNELENDLEVMNDTDMVTVAELKGRLE